MKLKIYISSLLFVLIVSSYFVYSFFYGDPFRKHYFKKSVQEYLINSYEEEFKINSITFSFKNSTIKNPAFYATISMESNETQIFNVYRDEQTNKLQDNVYRNIWDKEISSEVKIIFGKYYTNNAILIKNYIPKEPPHGKNSVYKIPLYGDYAASLTEEKRALINISLKKHYEEGDIENLNSIIQEITKDRVYFNIITIDFINDQFKTLATFKMNWNQAISVDNQHSILAYLKN
ncbi:hypothetical protein [Cohnella sp. GCM10012308]|uniref:YfjL-like protein n=1 Tax=Cohnella sp. GCM10012308 TaxID=3317329 RepID=UPI0036085BFE